MDKNQISQIADEQDSLTSQRRSTRIEYTTTVLISGKDAAGAPFREFTQTVIVNLHGCKIRTSYRILPGMLITLECPRAGTSGKGVCVEVWDSAPGIALHEIAVQLIKPQNLWGLPNPPPDWEIVAKAIVQGRMVQTERPSQPTEPAAPVAVPRAPAAPQTGTPVAPARQALVAGPTIEQRLAELERRSTQLMESVLDIMRGQAEELTRSSLEEFRQQVDALIQDAEGHLRQGLQQTYKESAASLIGLRTDLMDQMASRAAQMIRSTEDTLRTRLRSQLAAEDKITPVKPPAMPTKE
jgi:uncharacterized protein YukE